MYIHTSLIIDYLDQWFSKCGSQASSVGIACECVRTAASAFPAASGVQLACGSLSLKVESFFTQGNAPMAPVTCHKTHIPSYTVSAVDIVWITVIERERGKGRGS